MIGPIETNYRDCLFRSRLEARWAAFFDVLHWPWVYEPWDGNAYIPDFIVQGARPLVVEVKPCVTTQELMTYVPRVEDGIAGHWQGDYLIVGATPLPLQDRRARFAHAGIIGEWLDLVGYSGSPWCADIAEWHYCTARTCRVGCDGSHERAAAHECAQLAVHHPVQSFAGRPCGHYDGDHFLDIISLEAIEAAWNRAHRETRWIGDF